MPISQATILAIYGDLCDLVEKIETLHQTATEPDLFQSAYQRKLAVRSGIRQLRVAAQAVHRDALNHIIGEAPELEVHPLTGRIDE